MKDKMRIALTGLFLTVIASVMACSCARKINFEQSSKVPAADAEVKIKKDRNGNNIIKLTATHLAPADKLMPPKNCYVVWMVTSGNRTKNIGQLKSTSGLLSHAYKASLETTSSFNPVRIFITAEDDAAISRPSGQTILTTSDFQAG